MKRVGVAVAAMSLASAVVGVAVARAGGSGGPPSKAEVIGAQQRQHAVEDQMRHAPKPAKPTWTPKCAASGIHPRLIDSPEGDDNKLVDALANTGGPTGVAASGEDIYGIYAGASADDPSHGEIVVRTDVLDPCATPNHPPTFAGYTVPRAVGMVTLTGLNGHTVTYRDATGHTGSFDFVSGQFG